MASRNEGRSGNPCGRSSLNTGLGGKLGDRSGREGDIALGTGNPTGIRSGTIDGSEAGSDTWGGEILVACIGGI